MSKITAELLRAMVGVRPGARGLIDKLVEPLNLVLPAYDITTEYRISAFLATAAAETDWFRTLREYGKGEGRKYGKPDRVTGLVYYGRGIFQDTWKKSYQAFTDYVADNWDSIKPRALKYKWTVPPDFVAEPDLLATPYWAVEAACWYWKVNGLAKYADMGLRGFFGLQGLVNRGDATKKALAYEARLNSYEIARRLIADDFSLTPQVETDSAEALASASAEQALSDGETQANATEEIARSGSELPPADQSQPPSFFSWARWEPTLDKWQVRVDKITSWKSSLNPFSESISPISGASGATVTGSHVTGWPMIIKGFMLHDWFYLVPGLALVLIGGVAFLAFSKRNSAMRLAAPVQQTTVAVGTPA